MDERAIGAAAALTSAASWALGSILFKKIGDRLDPLALTLAKGAVGSALLFFILLFWGFGAVGPQDLLLLVLSGLLGISVGDALFFKALGNLGAHAIVVLLTVGQILTVLLAFFWLNESPNPIEWLGIGLISIGVTVVLWTRMQDDAASSLEGIAWGLAAVVCMAVATIIAKEALAVTDSMQAAFIRMIAGTSGVLCMVVSRGQVAEALRPLNKPGFAAFFVFSVAVVTFGGFWLSLLAIKSIDVAVANTLNSTEPLFVLPLAVWILKEKIGVAAVAGSLLTVFGIVLILRPWSG